VLPDGPDHRPTLPRRAHADDAGIDLCMNFDLPIKLGAGEIAVLPTGVRLSVLPGHVGKVEGRSGLATRGVIPLGAVPMDGLKVVGGQVPLGGIIDKNFVGAIGVIMANLGKQAWIAEPNQRICQLVEYKISCRTPVQVDALPGTDRGENGFGSTG
jgi:dUTP pyrophosphatase